MPSEQENNMIIQAQTYQQQMQNILMQKEALSIQSVELKRAVEEIDKTTEKEVYKISGTIIVKSPKDAVKKDILEKISSTDAMLKTLESSEKKIKAKMEELRGKFSKASKGAESD